MKLLAVIHSLDPGGTQRFLSNLVVGLDERGVDVSIVTLSQAEVPDYFALPGTVTRHRLSFDRPIDQQRLGKLRRDVRSIVALRSIVRESDPDVVLSLGWATNVITLASTRLCRMPVVISERVDPRDNATGRWWPIAQRLTYPFASHLVTQTAGVERHMTRWVRKGRISTLPNPVPESLFDVTLDPSPNPQIVAVCRLTRQKGVDVLLRAVQLVVNYVPQVSLSVVGDGPDRAALEQQAKQLGISERVSFHGMVEDPTEISRRAWCGCLASRNEGFPNALVEMMALGLACVSTDCRSGPAELLGDGCGVLVPVDDHQALADALRRVLDDAELRRALGVAARARAATFSQGRVVEAWFELLGRFCK